MKPRLETDYQAVIKQDLTKRADNLKNILQYKVSAKDREQIYSDVVGEPCKFDMEILFGNIEDMPFWEYNNNLNAIEEALNNLGYKSIKRKENRLWQRRQIFVVMLKK